METPWDSKTMPSLNVSYPSEVASVHIWHNEAWSNSLASLYIDCYRIARVCVFNWQNSTQV